MDKKIVKSQIWSAIKNIKKICKKYNVTLEIDDKNNIVVASAYLDEHNFYTEIEVKIP